ncbi:nose resistant to fluoxetine protein 6 [Ixodes scapularis]
MVPVAEELSILIDTLNDYYILPFYHAVCFFAGCITLLLVEKYREVRITKLVQASLWCIGLSCGLYDLFMKIDWYRSRDPTSETGKVFFAFSDRMVWSICLAWITFACSTGRGGILNRFLSWDGFVPLSRLSFGVYIIHFPFYLFTYHIARERVFFSHFTLVSQCFSVLVWSYLLSYFMFIACEAPTNHLRKLLFMRERNSAVKTAPGPEEHVQAERIEDGFNGRYGNVVVKANTPDQKPNSFNILSYSL